MNYLKIDNNDNKTNNKKFELFNFDYAKSIVENFDVNLVLF